MVQTSISFDTKEKRSLYALYKIPEYWVVNIPKERLEVYRHPEPAAGTAFGHDYGVSLIFQKGEEVSPLFEPNSISRGESAPHLSRRLGLPVEIIVQLASQLLAKPGRSFQLGQTGLGQPLQTPEMLE